ncbi:BapA/Bap/LapF family prefix-like domain-containing protein, partial [Acinetobacter pittii]
MTNFIVIEKDSLEKSIVNSNQITLTEASIVHTKMHRDDVEEFIRDGNNLLLKLKNGEVIVIENFFTAYDEVISDLVFEEDGCVLYWFDGVSDFKGIPGLEVLLPEAGSQLVSLLPWLAGLGAVGGVIAATHNDDDNSPSTPNGTNSIQVTSSGLITGKTENIPDGSKVNVTITGEDKDGNLISREIETTVNPDGSYTVEVPNDFADGDLKVESEVVDQNGNVVKAEDNLSGQDGLDRVDGTITVDVDNTGHITGGTTDVAPGSEVILTITGQDQAGNPLEQQVTATVQPDGSYTAEVPAGFADGELTVEAETVDRNGTPLNAEDNLSGQDGLDRVDGTITVDVDNTGHITGGTTDVAPGSEVILTITGQDQAGNPLEQQVTATVQPDGSYTAEVPAGFADGELTVEAETVDRNGTPLNAEDSLVKTDHDNDPSTPDQGGLDRVDGTITVDVDNTGHITGGTTDVAPGSEVILTITGQDQAGNPLEQQVTATVQPDGSYTAEVPAGFADGELTVDAETVDRNGTPIAAEDSLVKADHDNDPSTPDQGGLDRVDGTISVDVDNQGHITGGTIDVAPGSEVILTITGQDQAGNPLEQQVTATVQPDGSYTAEVPAGFADGELTVEAETVDRNGTPIAAEDSLVKTDHDNDPSTPDQGGLDRVDGSITVDVDNTGHITGGTTDVAPGSEVILTITGQDQAGNPLEQQVTATVQADGSYTAEVPAGFADGELTVEAETVDRNGTPIAAEDSLVKTDHDNDPSTPDQGGLDRVDGTITVDVDNTGHITGGTTDVAPGSEVILTITGQDQAGNPLEQQVTATVQPDGSYTAEVPAGFADGELTVEAETVDRNGTPVNAEDSLVKTDHDNDPSTPDQGGLDRVDGTITVDVDNTGHITGGTTDVAPGSEVILTITGQDQAGNPLEQQVTATVQPDGSYTAEVPAGFADGELTVEAETVDRNGTPVNAEDNLSGQDGLDRVDGTITVDVDNTGHITGGTSDVAPGSEVILTITGQDQAGNPLEQQVTATVQPDGSYTAEVPAGFADGELTVEAETVDRNGTPLNAEDNLSGQGGLDRVDGTITVDVDNTGHITGGTTDVAPGSEVILTITGQDQAGNPLEQQVTATVNPDGSYTAEVPAGFADGELTVEAETVDRNGTPLNAEDSLLKTDHDNDPSTPDQGGLDRVDGTITVDVDNTGHITGGTTDVAPGSEVILTITGQDQAGNPLEQQVTATVQPDGSYTAEVPAGFADGELTVEAETVDRNGTPLNAEDSLVKTDHDNDPSTPDQGGLDRVDGTITVDVDNTGHITGGTTDVAPGSEVILTITGQDQAGNPLEQQVTATVQPDGSYTAEVPAGFADGELTVEAETVDRNGTPLNAEDSLVKTDHDNDPSTPDQGGLDRVDGTITVDVDNTGHITGGTTDVAPGSEVILTITGQDQAGNPLEQQVTATVQPDGSYTAEVPAGFADGELTVEAETVDRNGTPLNAEDNLSGQDGLDRVDGTITVDVDNTGHITGGTTDVAPGSEVILTITGQDQSGNPLEQQVTATVQPDGSYTAEVPAGFADGELTVEAETVDRNG